MILWLALESHLKKKKSHTEESGSRDTKVVREVFFLSILLEVVYGEVFSCPSFQRQIMVVYFPVYQPKIVQSVVFFRSFFLEVVYFEVFSCLSFQKQFMVRYLRTCLVVYSKTSRFRIRNVDLPVKLIDRVRRELVENNTFSPQQLSQGGQLKQSNAQHVSHVADIRFLQDYESSYYTVDVLQLQR